MSSLTYSKLWEPRSTSTPIKLDVSTAMLQNILATVSNPTSVKEEIQGQGLDLTREELKTLVLKLHELTEPEKQELFDYVKVMQVRNPEMIKWVRNETRDQTGHREVNLSKYNIV